MIRFTEPCPQCDGEALLPGWETSSTPPQRCPSCFQGTVPDDATVEAVGKVPHRVYDPVGFGQWITLTAGDLLSPKVRRDLLIAAARHQEGL